jgi:hypothetical protein
LIVTPQAKAYDTNIDKKKQTHRLLQVCEFDNFFSPNNTSLANDSTTNNCIANDRTNDRRFHIFLRF